MADSGSSPSRGVAAFFDLDKTIIASSSALAFGRPLMREGMISRRTALKSAYAQLVFSLSGADEARTERLRAEISALCRGWDVAQLRTVVAGALHDVVTPIVYAEAAALLATHQAQGHDVIVLSATGEEVVTPIAAMLGADHSVGTRMSVVAGHYSGEIDFYCYGEHKAAAAGALAAERGYDLARCHAYSDSSTDVPLLEAVGHPHAVNADRALRRIAIERSWEIHTFEKPVSIRSRLPARTDVLVGLGLGIGIAAVAGSAAYGLSRRAGGRPA